MRIEDKSNRLRAFTLTEMIIALALATMLIGGVIVGHLVGARMFQYTTMKLGGNDEARKSISKLVDEVRMAKVVRIGNGDGYRFGECEENLPQQGNAIQIYPTSDTNYYVRYFLGSDTTLRRLIKGSASSSIVANHVTNQVVFTSENFSGAVLTNNENNRVIGLTLQFYQMQGIKVQIGANQMFDFYQLRTKVTRRALE